MLGVLVSIRYAEIMFDHFELTLGVLSSLISC